MRISLDWLKDYVEVPVEPGMLSERLTLAGMEVENIITQGTDFDGVLVAEIIGLRPHPNGGTNQLATVTTGKASLEIVTGAPNVAVGDRVPFAPVGAAIRGQRIGVKEVRGVRSEGMLCSPIELGLGEDADGILILDPDVPLGADLRTLYPTDTVLDLEIKSNRPDLLSHIGVAREVATLFKVPLRVPAVRSAPPAPGDFVTIEAPEGCRRFVGRLVRGVRVGPSPLWMQARLRAAGVRPISNVVDITNYVMLESGQPMHAFDHARLAQGRLVVRRARRGERLLCLDGKTRDMQPEFLVVADAERPQALAGIIGGAESAVGVGTTAVLLEAATWEARTIRTTARTIGLRTEASARFEKSLSPALSKPAVDRAASMLAELAQGREEKEADVYPAPLTPVPIDLTAARLERTLGLAVPLSEAATILERLEFSVKAAADRLHVIPPPFRLDCSIPEDVVEEVGRIYGYDRVPSTLPGSRTPVHDIFVAADADDRAREVLAGVGFDEAVTYGLVDRSTAFLVRLPQAPEDGLLVQNPMAENRDVMRVSLIPGLLEALALNDRHDQPGGRLFEIGAGFWRGSNPAKQPEEPKLLALAVHLAATNAEGAARELRAVQAALALLRERVGRLATEFRQSMAPGFHPGRTGEVLEDGRPIGIVGEVHPSVLAKLGLPGRAIAGEVLFEEFVRGGLAVPQAAPLPRFPGVRRDLTLIVRARVAGQELLQVMRQLGGYTLREISMLSEYEGPQLPAGARSLSFRLLYQAEDRTLTSEEVLGLHHAIVQGLRERFGVEVRG